MLFSSLVFIVGFLPAFILVYYASPAKAKNALAALASLFFYSWGEPVSCLILIGTSFVDFKITQSLRGRPPAAQKKLIFAGCFLGLLTLGFFKYLDFTIGTLNALFQINLPVLGVVLPIGISFYTFQKITYLIDVYKKDAEPAETFLDYILYVGFFPQLIAGPIVRYKDVSRQITTRIHSWVKFRNGCQRFTIGLAKKVLIANQLAVVADRAFNADPSGLNGPLAVIGLLAYTYQIYMDFSGYSDMALGLAGMFGFRFPENFNQPYLAKNFSDFWRRWHISLSTFMRDYLYKPLGGSRRGAGRTVLNLWIVFLISGLWHGASWNFIIWGAYHGAFISLSMVVKWDRYFPAWLSIVTTFVLVGMGWVLFRASNLSHAVQYWVAICDWTSPLDSGPFLTWYEFIQYRSVAMLVLSIILCSININRVKAHLVFKWARSYPLIRAVFCIFLFGLCVTNLVNTQYNPFIYFRF